MTVFIIMGVSGTGKSTIGTEAAAQLNIPFLDADDFHPPLNIAKMKSGVALAEEDRLAWTEAITQFIQSEHKGQSLVLACSALSKKTRARLRAGLFGDCVFIHLHGDHATLKLRLKARQGHFFSVDLLASQFTALQMPKRAHLVDIAKPIPAVTHAVCEIIKAEIST